LGIARNVLNCSGKSIKSFDTRIKKKLPSDARSGIHEASANHFLSGVKVMINTIWGKVAPFLKNKN
jgi:hypothetical protein